MLTFHFVQLLEHGADPNIWTPQHGTPLHIAAAAGHTAVVDVLLVHGACPFLCNANGKMAIELLLEGRPKVQSTTTTPMQSRVTLGKA